MEASSGRIGRGAAAGGWRFPRDRRRLVPLGRIQAPDSRRRAAGVCRLAPAGAARSAVFHPVQICMARPSTRARQDAHQRKLIHRLELLQVRYEGNRLLD
jgi:hypothetical protein